MDKLYVIGVGASAGGLEALSELFTNLPVSLQKITSFIVAQHVSPTHRSMLVQILSKEAMFPVIEATHNQEIEPGYIYITPPDSDIQVSSGKIILTKPKNTQGPKPSVDLFFQSLAVDFEEHSIGIILSGTGSDGACGLQEIKSKGGIAIIQNPESAKYDGMPLAALQTGTVDFSLPADKIGHKLEELLLYRRDTPEGSLELELQDIFQILNKKFGVNFENYRPTTIMRRIQKAMKALKLNSLSEYSKYLRKYPEEVNGLYQSFLIGVTSFFRDEKAFECLEKLLQEQIKHLEPGEMFRVWVAGCSTGEEVYSLAMVIHKLLSEYNLSPQLQIFATDIHEDSLHIARRGQYSLEQIQTIPLHYREKYVVETSKGFEIEKSIRSKILFSHHNLFLNPPFLKINLLSCRNLLIYLKPEIQRQLFPIFHYSLTDEGILFLGKSESVLQAEELFEVKDSKYKIFKKRKFANIRNLKFNTFQSLGFQSSLPQKREILQLQNLRTKILEAYSELSDYPFVILNSYLDIIETKGDLRDFMQIPQGVLNLNVSKLIRKELQVEVKSLILKSMKLHKPVKTPIKKFFLDGKKYFLKISVAPIYKEIIRETDDLYILIFEKYELEAELENSNLVGLEKNEQARIKELEQELSITKEHLQTYIEEIETANEELQSLNEELQSSNEELQSSNEELETSNEELQSANEELQTAYSEIKHVNEELKKREEELKKVNLRFEGLFENTLQGYILLEENLTIKLINSKAVELCKQIGLEKLEKGKNLLEYLSSEILKSFINPIRSLKENLKEIREIINFEYNKKIYYYDISFFPIFKTSSEELDYIGIGIIDITELKTKELEVFARDEILSSFLNSPSLYLIRTDMKGCYTYVNEAFCTKFGYTKDQLIGKYYAPTVYPDDIGLCEFAIYKLLNNTEEIVTVELRKPNPQGGFFETEWEFSLVRDKAGNIVEIQGVGRDITKLRKVQTELLNEKNKLELVIWAGGLGTWDWDLVNDKIEFNSRWGEILGYDLSTHKFNYSTWLELVHPEDRQKVASEIQATLSGATAYFEIEHRKKTASGTWKWMVVMGKVVERDFRGRPLRVIGIHVDITPRKEAEFREKEIEARNNLIINTMQEGVLVQDMSGTITFVNSSAEKILGKTSQELIGKKSYEEIIEILKEDGTFFSVQEHPFLKSIREGSSQNLETIGSIVNGQVKWISFNTQVLCHPYTQKPYLVFIVFHDITSRILAEKEIEKNRWLLTEMGRIARIGAWEYDILTKRITWTKEIFQIHELEEGAEPNLEQAISFYEESDRSVLVQAFNDLITHGKSYSLELRFYSASGKKLWVKTHGYALYSGKKISKAIGTFQDITDTIQNRLLIEENQMKLQTVIDSLPIALYILDKEGFINYYNSKVKELFGREPVLGKDRYCVAFKLFSSDGELYTQSNLPVVRALEEKKPILNERAIVEKPTGEKKYVLISVVPFFDKQKNITGTINLFHDITERILFEKELEEKNYKLETLYREQEELAYSASHDLQEPIQTILSCIEILKSEYPSQLEGEPRRLVQFIEHSASRMSLLVSGLLDYYRIGKDKKVEEVNVEDLVFEVIEEFKRQIFYPKAEIEVLPLPKILAYREELKFLFKNLLKNSFIFSKTELVKIQIWASEEKDSFVFHVADNGIGISQKDRQKAFVFFKRLQNRNEYEGVGMGLAHCKKIVELHGGNIWISDSHLGGITISFRLPKKLLVFLNQ